MTSRQDRLLIEFTTRWLQSQKVREGVAAMARSEVKNYLAELAELCEMPFTSPEGLIQALRTTAFIQLRDMESDLRTELDR
jgi:hypothetical protein